MQRQKVTWVELIFLRWIRILLRNCQCLCTILINSSYHTINIRSPIQNVYCFSIIHINFQCLFRIHFSLSKLLFISVLSIIMYLFCLQPVSNLFSEEWKNGEENWLLSIIVEVWNYIIHEAWEQLTKKVAMDPKC